MGSMWRGEDGPSDASRLLPAHGQTDHNGPPIIRLVVATVHEASRFQAIEQVGGAAAAEAQLLAQL